MNQPTFADLDYESKKRKTRREKFLSQLDLIPSWKSFRPSQLRVIGDATDTLRAVVLQPERWDGGHALRSNGEAVVGLRLPSPCRTRQILNF